jgi:hypothetical protein
MSDVQERYNDIIAEAAAAKRSEASAAEDRRTAPRVSVVAGDMSVNLEVAVSPVDISSGGVCFFAERPFPIGSEIEVSIAAAFKVRATVVHCAMEESGSEFLEVHYCVRCQFSDHEQGMQLLVLAKDRENRF